MKKGTTKIYIRIIKEAPRYGNKKVGKIKYMVCENMKF